MIVFTFITAPWAGASPIKEVVTASPSWDNFTNKNGTGLYHEILNQIFFPLSIKVIHKYTNAKRGMYMLRHDLADIYTCRPEIEEFPQFMLARHQMYEGQFHAVFKKSRFPHWQGISSLAHQKIVWRRGYYTVSEFKVSITVVETDSGPAALAQLSLDRVDAYIDDLNLIDESFSHSLFPIDRSAYGIEPVGRRRYYPVFKSSERGKAIMELYDQGMERLEGSGKLQKIFKKYGHGYPDYE